MNSDKLKCDREHAVFARFLATAPNFAGVQIQRFDHSGPRMCRYKERFSANLIKFILEVLASADLAKITKQIQAIPSARY